MLFEIVGNLLLLRFLGLRLTVLDSIPSAVGKLPCLETLDLKHTNVTTLPNSIWKAKNLRHLYMNEVHIDAFLQKLSKGSLSNLQTLRGLYVGNESVVTNSLDRLVNVRKLGLTCHKKSVKAVVKWVLLLPNLHSLKLRSIDEFGKPLNIELVSLEKQTKLCNLYLLGELVEQVNLALVKQVNLSGVLPSCLKKLTLSMSALTEDPMPVLSKLPELSILRLFAHSYLGHQMTCDGEGFLKLRVLKLWMLNQLRSWTVKKGTMPILQELEIRGCDALTNIDGIEHLQGLKELTLTDMREDFIKIIKRGVGSEMYTKVNEWKLSRHQVGLYCPHVQFCLYVMLSYSDSCLDWRLDDKEESSYSGTGPSRAAAQLLRRWHQRIPVSGAADPVELRGFVVDEKALSWVTVLWQQQRQGSSLSHGGSKLLTATAQVKAEKLCRSLDSANVLDEQLSVAGAALVQVDDEH
ncbi:putative disease resistance protein At1g59780 [Syzygium oleosum]|uniref:putative disease resistance protein At1g59780 n=1 Tax=Syzygium oleosum TaxID=219896 RepID=UPI0024B99A72|nr:putative disease resistance protein At1g59780 [Syzygium oleosum]